MPVVLRQYNPSSRSNNRFFLLQQYRSTRATGNHDANMIPNQRLSHPRASHCDINAQKKGRNRVLKVDILMQLISHEISDFYRRKIMLWMIRNFWKSFSTLIESFAFITFFRGHSNEKNTLLEEVLIFGSDKLFEIMLLKLQRLRFWTFSDSRTISWTSERNTDNCQFNIWNNAWNNFWTMRKETMLFL